MSNLYYAYKNKLWKVIHNFQYTGKAEPFTLDPGKYLLICHGAKGGIASYQSLTQGGSSYGVLNLQKRTQMYAVVGGDGEPPSDNATPGKGGFNGGGDGGRSYNNAYTPGAGGGGASDIRLSNDDTVITESRVCQLPSEYQEVEYIESTGTQYIDTGLPGPITAEIDLQFVSGHSTRQLMGFSLYAGSYFGMNTSYCYGIYNDISGTDARNRGVIKYYYADNSTCWLRYNDNSVSEKSGNNSKYTFKLFTCDPSGGSYPCYVRIYSAKISVDFVYQYLVPCYRKSDNVVGMYDIINSKFYQNKGTGTFLMGTEVADENKTSYTHSYWYNKSRNTCLIVAGGGGGGTNLNTSSYVSYCSYGGGPVGGFVNDNDRLSFATQTYGGGLYSYIGTGAVPVAKTAGDKGASGGGGGWYGGYASTSSSAGNYSATNGGGGSGYVLTESSFKPIGYMLGEEYYLTDTHMEPWGSMESQVLVCVEVEYPTSPGDIIIFPCVGESSQITLPRGKYKLKCWGGDGGCRTNIAESPRGGYSEGVLTLTDPTTIIGTVGGSGIGTGIQNASYKTTLKYNGGGSQGTGGSTSYYQCAGGGATDFRIGSDSLYARVIVAGGAGGNGGPGRFGGVGGGETGGTNTTTSGTSGFGTSSGPGTQTSSPQNSSYSTINGGFGYGGNGVTANSGYGGAGGGGWYGGSGTYPDGSGDDDRGGNGGSGYVLTASSFKPTGYLLGEEYYLTDGKTIAGGNDLPIGQTRAEIEVIECTTYKMLCYDEEGYKRYNESSNSWVLLSNQNQPTPETFEEFGTFTFPTDDGLLDEYDIMVHDPEEKLLNVSLNVIPPEQHISRTIMNKMNIAKLIIDADFDPEIYDVRYNVKRKGYGSDTRITLNMYVKKKVESNKKFKMYCIQAYSR